MWEGEAHRTEQGKPTDEGRSTGTGVAYWLMVVLALVIAISGAVLLVGGVWLIALGGSWYYALAGVGLVAAAVFLVKASMTGLWLYLITYLATIAWALWEVGFDGWALVPRVVAPTVLLVLVLLSIPVLRRGPRGPVGTFPKATAAAVVLALVVTGGFAVTDLTGPVVAQDGQAGSDDTSGMVDPDPLTAVQPSTPADAQSTAASDEIIRPMAVGDAWPAYGGSYEATRYSPLDAIDRDNVSRLAVAWEFQTGDMPSQEAAGEYSPETTPLNVNDSLYLCSAKNILIALDAASGLERWRFDPVVPDDAIPYGATCRGVAYYEIPGMRATEACATRIIEGTLDARLIAVDAETGQPCADFGVSGEVNLLEGIGESVPGFFAVTSPPTIVRGVVVVGHQVNDNQQLDAPSGVVRGYDAVTGELLWAWDMLRPELDGLPPEGETYSRGTPNMWTIAAGDDALGLVYLPMGNSAVDYYGAERTEVENEYATSLVALNVESGEVAWHFQTVHYDVWDYDLGSQPTLIDFPGDAGPVPAVVLASKQGEIYILDRRTGEPLVPVEERAVPSGGVEPEDLSSTQPFSAYHTLRQPPLTEVDMWGMSPLDQLWCRIQFHRAVYDGIYTPPTVGQHWIQYPGYNGGSDWGGVAVDEQRGILVANYNDMPNYNRLVPREEADELGVHPITEAGGGEGPEGYSPQAGVPYAIEVNAGWRLGLTGLMCKEPPYGGIRAIDLATGETLWDRPLGTAQRNGPFGIPSMLPFDIGTPNNGGPLITASGLVFIAAATDDLIRAIDIETGETVWSDELPAGGQATPMTFEADGRQFVVIMAGGHHFMETPIGDDLIAYALTEGG